MENRIDKPTKPAKQQVVVNCSHSMRSLRIEYEAIRRIALKGTELANNLSVGTIRLKLFKIGAVILKNTRRIRFLLASGQSLQGTLLPGRESTRTRINPKRLKHSRVENTHGYLC